MYQVWNRERLDGHQIKFDLIFDHSCLIFRSRFVHETPNQVHEHDSNVSDWISD